MDDGGSDGGMDMMGSMSMTFAPFSTYQLKVIWGWWDVQTEGQYIATLLGMFVAVVLFRWLVKFETAYVKRALAVTTLAGNIDCSGRGEREGKSYRNDTLGVNTELEESLLTREGHEDAAGLGPRVSSLSKVPFQKRVVQAALSAFLYMYALLLMLAAMTYNPGIFLALGIGYAVGELFFGTAFETELISGRRERKERCCE
jgi:hypothetical protein